MYLSVALLYVVTALNTILLDYSDLWHYFHAANSFSVSANLFLSSLTLPYVRDNGKAEKCLWHRQQFKNCSLFYSFS